jgi:hypothetical protein
VVSRDSTRSDQGSIQGEEITEDTTRSRRMVSYDRTPRFRLLSCSLDATPERVDFDRKYSNERFGVHQLTRSATGMDVVGNICVEVGALNIASMKTKRQFGFFGRKSYKVDCEVQVKFGSKSGLLEVNAFCGSTAAGRAEIQYE